MSDPRDILDAAVRVAGAELDGSDDPLREVDLERALHVGLESAVGPKAVRRQFSVDPGRLWRGRPGPVDLWLGGTPASLIEVKWSAGALPACAWDCLKLAAVVTQLDRHRGFIVAGAPAGAWEEPVLGAEFLSEATWTLEDVLRRYAPQFAFWREDVANYPLRLPSAGRTAPVAATELRVAGQRWRIHASEVLVDDPTLRRVAYVPTLATWMRGERRVEPDAPKPSEQGTETTELPDVAAEQRLLLHLNGPRGRMTAFDVFYDEQLGQGEKEARLNQLAAAGDAEAAGYLRSFRMRRDFLGFPKEDADDR